MRRGGRAVLLGPDRAGTSVLAAQGALQIVERRQAGEMALGVDEQHRRVTIDAPTLLGRACSVEHQGESQSLAAPDIGRNAVIGMFDGLKALPVRRIDRDHFEAVAILGVDRVE